MIRALRVFVLGAFAIQSRSLPLPVCKGEEMVKADELKSLKDVADDALYRFVADRAGAPAACEVSFQRTGDGVNSMLRVTFTDGSLYFAQSMPPETSIVGLRLASGFRNREEALAVLRRASQDFHVDWGKPSTDESKDAASLYRGFVSGRGKIVRYSDPDAGLNAMADLIYDDGKLVGIGFHFAL